MAGCRRHTSGGKNHEIPRVYACRIIGGDCDHRRADRPAAAGGAGCTGGCAAVIVQQQPEAAGARPAQPPRRQASLPAGGDPANDQSNRGELELACRYPAIYGRRRSSWPPHVQCQYGVWLECPLCGRECVVQHGDQHLPMPVEQVPSALFGDNGRNHVSLG